MIEQAPMDIVLIGGTATQTKAYPTLCHVGKWFVDHKYETTFIDGAVVNDNDLVVLTPNQQADEVRKAIPDINNPRKRFLYITHCVGMAAAVDLMSKDCGNSRLVALSPALPTPFSTVSQPHFLKNVVDNGGRQLVPAYSWSDEPFKPTLNASRIDALLPDSYFDELSEAAPKFATDVNRLEKLGRIKLVIPLNDWNQPGVETAKGFSNLMHVNANHSLLDQTFSHAPDALYRRIVNFALD